jgi:hypothetical protein
MNNPSTAEIAAKAKPCAQLLDVIREMHDSVGDGLNDNEFTRLLEKTDLSGEAGFAFLSYGDRFVTLSVPPQHLANWHPEKGWIVQEKEKIARAIAEKHDLTLCVPPDTLFSWHDSPNPHHHFELSNGRETVVIIHPQYLKIRLFVATERGLYTRVAQRPLNLGADLLQELSALYDAIGQ